ncbi:unnamed protein product [Amoebophrya sp. A120]|nr:unnamed protein product [Amoebophrya sp. A120]|eukprot:GSA120T00021677001.1
MAGKSEVNKEWEAKWRAEKQEEEARFGWSQLEKNKRGKDKSIPKIQKFQNKLKKFTTNDLASLKKDLDSLDLGKYVEELSECFVECVTTGAFKLKDLPAVVELFAHLHAGYQAENFAGSLEKSLQKAWGQASFSKDLFPRRRVYCRLAGELALLKIVPERIFAIFLQDVCTACDKGEDDEQLCNAFAILASVMQKQGLACTGVLSKTQREMEEGIGREWKRTRLCVLNDTTQSTLAYAIKSVFEKAGGRGLAHANQHVLEQQRLNDAMMIDKGVVDAEWDGKLTRFKEHKATLEKHLQSLAESLDLDMPDYKTAAQKREEETTTTIGGGTAAAGGGAPEGAGASSSSRKDHDGGDHHPSGVNPDLRYLDSTEAKMYEDLLDLKDVVPEKYLGLAPKDERTQHLERTTEMDTGKFEVFLDKLASSDRIDRLNELAMTFAHDWSSKACRRRIATVLSRVKRIHSAYIPFHCRWLATVNPYFRDVADMVTKDLLKERDLVLPDKSPDPVVMERKQRNIKFLAELVKFRLCPPGIILDTFSQILDDFHEVSTSCCLLEHCGRWLLHTQETKLRFENLLERMMRLKNHKKGLDLRDEMAIDDAYYQLKPPENKKRELADKEGQMKKSEIERLIMWLCSTYIYIADDVHSAVHLVLQLPWSTIRATRKSGAKLRVKTGCVYKEEASKVEVWLKRGLLDLNLHADYEHLWCVAHFLKDLSEYREDFTLDCVDTLLEEIQLGLEKADFRDQPLRTRQLKLLGEFYAFRLVDSQVVFDVLYQLIGWGGATSYRASHLTRLYDLFGQRILAVWEDYVRTEPKRNRPSPADETNASTADGNGKVDKKSQRFSRRNRSKPTYVQMLATEFPNLPNNDNIDAVARALDFFEKDYELWHEFSKFWLWPHGIHHPDHVGADFADTFRLRQVCVLLDSIGHFFKAGAAKIKMQKFCVFFRRFALVRPEMLTIRALNAVEDSLELVQEPIGDALKADTDVLKILKHDLLTVRQASEKAIEAAEAKDARKADGGSPSSSGSPSDSESSSSEEDEDDSTDEYTDTDEDQNLGLPPAPAEPQMSEADLMQVAMDQEILAMTNAGIEDVKRHRHAQNVGGRNTMNSLRTAGAEVSSSAASSTSGSFSKVTPGAAPASGGTQQSRPGFLDFKVLSRSANQPGGPKREPKVIHVPEDNMLSQACLLNISQQTQIATRKKEEEDLLKRRTLQAAMNSHQDDVFSMHSQPKQNKKDAGNYLSQNVLPEEQRQPQGNVVFRHGKKR